MWVRWGGSTFASETRDGETNLLSGGEGGGTSHTLSFRCFGVGDEQWWVITWTGQFVTWRRQILVCVDCDVDCNAKCCNASQPSCSEREA